MFQVHGKTRRGRPPKYQQYWIALAMEKAAQRALENGKGQNSEAVNAATDNLPALKDDITTKETRLQQQENAAANRTEKKDSEQPHLKRRSNSWPLNENGKDGVDGSTSQSNPLPVRRTLQRTNSCSGGGAESREDFMIVKKFKTNDVQSSDHFKSSNASQSTWNDKLCSGDVPFLVSSPYRQVTKGIIAPTSEQKSPFEGQPGSGKVGNFFPRVALNCAGFVRDGIGGFYDNLPDCGQVQFVADAEKSDYALDLSSKLLPTGNREDNTRHAVSAEYVSVEKQVQLNAAAPLENRQLLNVVQPWNSGQLPEEMHAWNADKMMSVEQERKGYSTQPMMLRAFPCSRLAEVSMWTVEEVVRFVAMIPGCHEYAECFRDEDIDGSSLLQLSESHLRNIIRMRLGPSLHLKKALDDLASFSSNSTA